MSGWESLTRLPEKASAFRTDPLTRTALAAAGTGLAARLWDLALIVVKPEALVSGRMAGVQRFLATHRLSVVSSFDTELDAARSHALWSYPWVKATTDRVRLHVMMSEREPARCLLVRRDEPGGDMPLTMWIAVRKGSSNGRARSAGQLRTELGMTNRMIAFVHCPDEPADLVRDLYVLGGEQALDLLAKAPARVPSESWAPVPRQQVSLDLDDLLGGLTPHGRDQLRQERGPVGLDDALRLVRTWGARGRWAECALAAELIPHDLPGVGSEFDRLSVEQLAELWQGTTT